jgi:hypothetical protein
VAGPSVVVRVLGDLGGLNKSFDQATSKANNSAKSIQGGFHSALGVLNQTGALEPFMGVLDGIGQSMEAISGHAKGMSTAMIGVGGALAGVGAGLSVAGSKDKAAHEQLQASVDATGHSYEDYAGQIEAAIKHQEKFGDTANQTQDALRVLTQATGNPAKALQYLSTATDLAAAKHEDLTAAATTVGKVYNGNTKVLKEFGIQVTKTSAVQKAAAAAVKTAAKDDAAVIVAKRKLIDLEQIDAAKKHLTVAETIRLRDAQQKVRDATLTAAEAHKRLGAAQDAAKDAAKKQGSVMTDLSARLHGQASAAADTFSGHIAAIKAHLEDSVATLGQKYGPALTAVGTAIGSVGAAAKIAQGVMGTFKKAQEGVAVATDAVTASEDAAAVSEGLALGPILLIIAAIGLLILAAYEIYKHWKTIWADIKKIITDVWDWIKANWPLLLGILLGPIAIAAALIATHWRAIKNGLQVVFNWIATTWQTITGYLTAPIATAVRVIVTTFSTVVTGIQGAWGAVVSWIARLPGSIASLAAGMWHGVTDAFRSAINAVIDVWDSLHFTIGGWTVGVGPVHVTLPTVDVGLPSIPHLAQGGLMTSSGLVYAHAGEVITPTPKSARGVNYTVNVYVPPIANPAEVGRSVVAAIRAYERSNTAAWRAA